MTAAEVRTTAPPHPGGSVLASSGARASSRGASSESPRGRPGALRGGDRGSVRRTHAGISEGRSRRASSGLPEAWRPGSHRGSSRCYLHPPQARVRSNPPAYLSLPPAERKGTPTASNPQVRQAAMTPRAGADQKAGDSQVQGQSLKRRGGTMEEAPPTSSRSSLPRLSRGSIGRSRGLGVRKRADVAGRGSLSVLWLCCGS